MAEDGITEVSGYNQRGEMWVRAQNIMKGYWRKPEATRQIKTKDGWLKTGDVAYVDDQGKFHIVDRMKVCCECKLIDCPVFRIDANRWDYRS